MWFSRRAALQLGNNNYSDFAKMRLAEYKVPHQIIFTENPRMDPPERLTENFARERS
jgi:hypothetical protein